MREPERVSTWQCLGEVCHTNPEEEEEEEQQEKEKEERIGLLFCVFSLAESQGDDQMRGQRSTHHPSSAARRSVTQLCVCLIRRETVSEKKKKPF